MRPLACILLLAALPAPAMAQEEDPVQAMLAEAVREHERGNYQEAYALFLRVHEARPSARTQRALGKAAFELRRYRDAAEWFEASLADARNPLTDEMRAEVQGLLERARAFLGRFVLHANAPESSIQVDGQALEGEAIVLEAGEHEIVATASGYDRLTRPLVVRGGEDETIELELARTSVAVAASDPGELFRGLGWASFGLGVGLVASGVIATVIWADTVSTLNRNIDSGVCTIDPVTESVVSGDGACFDQQDRYRLALPFMWVGFAGGAALVALGLGLVLGAPGPENATALSCAPFAELGLACGGRF